MGKMIYPTLISFTDSLPFFPRGMGVCHEQESVDRPKGFHLYQWRQCRKGKGELFRQQAVRKAQSDKLSDYHIPLAVHQDLHS